MALDLIDINTRELLNLLKQAYYEQTGNTIQIGSDEFASAAVQSYVWSVLLSSINNETQNRFIDTATGSYLDAIAANYGINSRPDGYRATAYFSLTYTNNHIQIPANSLIISDSSGKRFTNLYPFEGITGDSHIFYAVEAGESYNGIPANKITTVVEGSAYISAAMNTTMTSGGTESMADDDDAFRVWLKTQIQSFAGAGTYEAYEARAKNADSRVTSVYVLRQDDDGYEKGKVKIFILSDSDSDPSHSCVDIVQNSCSDPAFRPIGDLVVTSYAGTTTQHVGNTLQTTYPSRFAGVASTRNTRIYNEYISDLQKTINRPFKWDELCSRLCTADEDGVYCTDAKPLGIGLSQHTPYYPEAGCVISLTGIYFGIVYDSNEA